MHRMTQAQFFSRFNSLKAIAVCAAMYALPVTAQMPLADADYDASGYVTPAGMAHPSMYQGGVVPAGMTYSAGLQGGPTAYPGGVMPVGFLGGQCDGNCASCDPGAAACGCNKEKRNSRWPDRIWPLWLRFVRKRRLLRFAIKILLLLSR